MIVTSAAVVTTKFLLGMYDCMISRGDCTDDFPLVLGFCKCVDRTCLRAWTDTHSKEPVQFFNQERQQKECNLQNSLVSSTVFG